MIYLSLFIIGTIFGSFYTVVGLRRPISKSIIKPRSHCDNCNHILKWYELIPIISFLMQKGKCRYCHVKIPLTYPLIEILCGILFLLSYYIFGFSYHMLIMLFLSSLLIIIYVSDFKYYVILDGPLIIFSILILITKLYFLGFNSFLGYLISGCIMFLIMYLIKIFGDFIFKRESLGGGDIKLSFIMGISVGLTSSLISLIVSSFIALPYAFYIILSKKGEEMPFGPFLITALLIVFILSEPITNLLKLLYF